MLIIFTCPLCLTTFLQRFKSNLAARGTFYYYTSKLKNRKHLLTFSKATISLLLALWLPSTSLAQGLSPHTPPSRDAVSNHLRAQPDSESQLLYLIQPSDRIIILRSTGKWYEVDIVTPQGLEYRGWIEGETPLERRRSPADEPIELEPVTKQEPQEPDLFWHSDRLRWFWSGELQEHLRVRVGAGAEQLDYQIQGVQDGELKDMPGYQFTSPLLSFAGELTALEAQVFGQNFGFPLRSRYQLGFHQVSFPVNFRANPEDEEPHELAGTGYQILTHHLEIEGGLSIRHSPHSQLSLENSIRFGFRFYETAPDLRKVDGKVVFRQTRLSGLPLAFETRIELLKRVNLSFRASLLLLSKMSESPEPAQQEESLRTQGLPWSADASLSYQWHPHWRLGISVSYFQAKGFHPGPSERLNGVHEDVEIELSSIRPLVELQAQF